MFDEKATLSFDFSPNNSTIISEKSSFLLAYCSR